MKKTKIVCTMGPNAWNTDTLKNMMEAGMDVARLNFSHGDHEEQGNNIKNIKKLREEIGRPIAIMLDTKGPEIRSGKFAESEDETVELVEGSTVEVYIDGRIGDATHLNINYSGLINDVEPGNRILLDDGLMELTVVSKAKDSLTCKVTTGGTLGGKKGVNIPNVKVNLPALTEKDKGDIIFGIEQGIDFIAASFVRKASDVREIRKILKEHNGEHIGIISKIENGEGVDNIDEIIKESDGIMVARGDLGVEIPAEQVPFVQKRIIQKCNQACKPVITATQMLDSMIRNPRPTRAEVTDVANAIYDGTDAIMLSGETAMGKYPVDAIKMMTGIAEATEEHLDYELHMKKMKNDADISSAVAFSCVATASSVGAKYILASTMSGATARIISKFKPNCEILGLSPVPETLRKMQIFWGVTPIATEKATGSSEITNIALKTIEDKKLVKAGDTVVLSCGGSYNKDINTDMMKVLKIH